MHAQHRGFGQAVTEWSNIIEKVLYEARREQSGLGYRVYGVGYRVWGLGFRV